MRLAYFMHRAHIGIPEFMESDAYWKMSVPLRTKLKV